jgi:hypothetical protein
VFRPLAAKYAAMPSISSVEAMLTYLQQILASQIDPKVLLQRDQEVVASSRSTRATKRANNP